MEVNIYYIINYSIEMNKIEYSMEKKENKLRNSNNNYLIYSLAFYEFNFFLISNKY